MSSSKTGKHGHTKVHLVCIDIFTGKKLEDVVPATHEVDVPNIHRDEYRLEGVDSGHLVLTDQDGNAKNDVTVPDGDIGSQIMDRLDSGDSSIVTILRAMNEQACIGYRDA
ncbi:eukaryotic translation initiation factor 5A [Aspergillus chevalieri]|uniref:Eukaryotic translation initiation factor 5A n=1 Tax=Aspergillus chevalieri TaxID=182096 RepID=A0A7R7VXL3_ASPCH|nr:eukaryotic translation initiation factor 5A [Aspergillus chevalieri]BCR92575.1 eukaryotic translation initiation factor 5A [Aspergillus chevalieri]